MTLELSMEEGSGSARREYRGKCKGGKGFGTGRGLGRAGPGDTSVRKILPVHRYVGAVLDFLSSTKIKKLKSRIL